MNLLDGSIGSIAFILLQPLPPIPQQTSPDWVQFALNALFAVLWAIVGALIFSATMAIAMRLYCQLTPGFDELRELREGNLAVGITMAAFILSISAVVVAILIK